MGEARFRAALRSALKEKPQWQTKEQPQWQTKEQPEREPSIPHLEQIWEV